jgi:UDP-N-acetylglucosamine--N-acetylmuramyl-(pentapeptide) pyrophosphoryl-undecaprenol N-acetylglucosamine transferase
MRRDIRIIFAGGGTGGHVFPAIYMAEYLQKQWGASCQFVGTKKGFENRKVPQSGFMIHHIWISGFRRGFYLSNLLFPLKLLVSSVQSRRILKQLRPHLVIGTGGYVAGPILRQAVKAGIPTAIQEQNSYPGITTRLLASKVNCVFIAYKEALNYLKDVKRYIISGNPIRANIISNDLNMARKFFGLTDRMPVVLIFGGSQGARNLNIAIDKILEKKILKNVQLIWQTGADEFDKYQKKYEKSGNIYLCILPFIDQMDLAYSISEFAVTRAGAMTISELAAAKLPAILVPYPHAAADHQKKNAEAISSAGGTLMIEDDDKLPKTLGDAIVNLLASREKVQEMKKRISHFHNQNTMALISEELSRLIETNANQA